jgi:hypothetical protein
VFKNSSRLLKTQSSQLFAQSLQKGEKMDRKSSISHFCLGLKKLLTFNSLPFTLHALRFTVHPSRFTLHTLCSSRFTLYDLRSLLRFTHYASLFMVSVFFTLLFTPYALPSLTFAADKLVIIGSDNADTVKIVGSDISGTYSDMHVYKENYWSLNFFDTYSSVYSYHSPFFIMRRARGSTASPSAVVYGDQIGGFSMRGYDGSAWRQTALISGWIDGTVSAGVVPMQIRFYTGSTSLQQSMVITSAGKVGIGTSDPQYLLQLQGGAYSDGTNWYSGSSRDYKENIRELDTDEALLAFNKLDPVTFNYKTNNEERHVGFIAEDVPDLIATKDRKGLSPMDIVALLTKVIQEQQKTISELSEKVSKLEKLIK